MSDKKNAKLPTPALDVNNLTPRLEATRVFPEGFDPTPPVLRNALESVSKSVRELIPVDTEPISVLPASPDFLSPGD